MDKGPWRADDVGAAVYSDDFELDVSLHISGDFPDASVRIAYAKWLALRLNDVDLAVERDRLRELVCEVAMSGREFDDPRVPYVTAQIDRAIWHGLRAALDGHDATEP